MEITTGTDGPTRGKLILSATRDFVTGTALLSGTLDVNAGTYCRSSFSADPRRGQRSKDMKGIPRLERRQPPVYRRMGAKSIHRTSGTYACMHVCMYAGSLPLWEGGDTEEPAGRGGDLPDRPRARGSLFARTLHCSTSRRIGAVSARDDGGPHIFARRRAARANPRSTTVPFGAVDFESTTQVEAQAIEPASYHLDVPLFPRPRPKPKRSTP